MRSPRILLLLLLLESAAAGAMAPLPAQAPAARDTLHIAFVGDLNFGRSLATKYIFTGRGPEVLLGLRDRLRAADIAVGNLESLLLERGQNADTSSSPTFAGPQAEAIAILKDAGFDVLGDANNHAWDFGRPGVLENIAHLDSAGLAHAGTGPTLDDAWRPVVVRVKGWTVAFFSLTAIFNYPDLTVVGHAAACCVAWADTLRAAQRFRAVRDSVHADLVIAFVHAGLEYKPVPERDVVQRFRGLIRAGADAVIGHHPHVPQGIEYLDGKPIVYSLGNCVFMQARPWTNRGLMAELTVFPGDGERLTILPLDAGYTPTFATGRDSARVMAHVDSISRLIPANPRLPKLLRRRNVAHPRTAGRT